MNIKGKSVLYKIGEDIIELTPQELAIQLTEKDYAEIMSMRISMNGENK